MRVGNSFSKSGPREITFMNNIQSPKFSFIPFRWRAALVVLLAAIGVSCAHAAQTLSADIIVYGDTSAAVVAAVQAKKEGKSVILVAPQTHLGAMTSAGLGFTDSGKAYTIGGMSKEFYHRVWLEYQKDSAWNLQKRSEFNAQGQGTTAINNETQTMWVFEPKVAERIYDQWLEEYGIPVYRNEKLNREKGVRKLGKRITSIQTLSKKRFRGKMFLDCTFEGDLMAAAGCEYYVGREANSQYGEDYNGGRTTLEYNGHHFKSKISAYKAPGEPSSGLLKFIRPDPLTPEGEADKRVQSYCYRMCLTDYEPNRLPITKPENYSPEDYELFARYFASGEKPPVMTTSRMPNFKTDSNNHGAFSLDFIGMNYEYPEASYEERQKIMDAHRQYQLGLLYFLQNDPRLSDEIRERWQKWGLPKDEFTDNDHWPHNLYIREARRMIGHYVMTQADCQSKVKTPMSVGMGSYTLDSHNTHRYVTDDGYVQNEGDVEVRLNGPYQIAYGALIPQKKDCSNLLVPVACSASHIAFGSIRMEPVFMILGQSAATAASLAVDSKKTVHEIDYSILREKLLKDGQILEIESK